MNDILPPDRRRPMVRLKPHLLPKQPARQPGVELPPIEVYAEIPEPVVTRRQDIPPPITCRVCGETKDRWQFSNLPEFFKLCSDCEFSVYPFQTPRHPNYSWADANLIALTTSVIKLLERECGTARRTTGSRSGRPSRANV